MPAIMVSRRSRTGSPFVQLPSSPLNAALRLADRRVCARRKTGSARSANENLAGAVLTGGRFSCFESGPKEESIMSLTGVWLNEHKSIMVIEEHSNGTLTGMFRSLVGRDIRKRPLSGRTSPEESAKQLLGF